MRVLVIVAVGACSFTPGRLATTRDDAGLDAPVSDVLDVMLDSDVAMLTCPPEYDITIESSTTSYRAIATESSFSAQHADCSNDLANATHLVSIETVAELDELIANLNPRTVAPSRRYYTGTVQQQNQASETAGWLVFSGAALPANQWSSGQPNDDGSGENNAENIATLNVDDKLNDATGDLSYGALCECDGTPVPANVLALLP